MDDRTSFDEKKTVKVSGVSQLLRDQLTKAFQSEGNSTRFFDDVNRLYVCPNGQDYVVVEFAMKDIPAGIKPFKRLYITLLYSLQHAFTRAGFSFILVSFVPQQSMLFVIFRLQICVPSVYVVPKFRPVW